MKLIPLSQGMFAKVDNEDFEILSKHKWFARRVRNSKLAYAQRWEKCDKSKSGQRRVIMHRFLIGAKGEFVDHINGDGLDNRKSNLRLCSNAQNVQNTGLTRANTSGYKGIRLRNGRWDSRITCLNKTYHLGVFSTKEEAARAYNAAAIELHGEFARLNDV